MTSINTNNAAIKAFLASTYNTTNLDRISKRLSSGLRVNTAADDAAGYTVANRMAAQLASIRAAMNNAANSVSLIQNALGGMETSQNVLQRMRELAIQSNNNVYTFSDRKNAQEEIDNLLRELRRLSENTNFNNVHLLDGSFNASMRVGASNNEVMDVKIGSIGINKNIEGRAYASGSSQQILSPYEIGVGSSKFDIPNYSSMQGPSTPIYLDQSNGVGTSQFNYQTTSSASGSSAYKIINSSDAFGSSNQNYEAITSAAGSDLVNYSVNNSAVGTSLFQTPASSNGSGISILNLSSSETAQGSSNFDTPTSSTATGSSNLDYLSNTTGSGTSEFNTVQSSQGTGTSNLAILANNTATALNGSDSSVSSTASGTSIRDILLTNIATGTSNFDQLALSEGTGTSSPAGILSSADATVSSGGASTLVDITFENHDFSQGVGSSSAGISGAVVNIPGWEVHLKQVTLDPQSSSVNKTIGGFSTPTDTSQPTNSPGDGAVVQPWNGNPVRFNYTIANNSVTLGTNDIETTAYGQVHGPYIISADPLSLRAGDSISFDWQAIGSGDAADVYAYLLDVNDGSTVELLNYTHNTVGATPTFNVNQQLSEDGNFKFVFISGSYDKTGGQQLGSNLTISNIAINQLDPSQSQMTAAETTLQAYEANNVTISRQRLGELDRIFGEDPGTGVFSIRQVGGDHNKFTIDNQGNISSTQTLLRQTQESYEFEVLYQNSTGGSHIEKITLNLLNSARASSNISAQEGNQVKIQRSALTLLDSFSQDDNFRGNFRIIPSGNDYNKFQISANGDITSIGSLEFNNQNYYQFEVAYTSSSGQQLTNEISLHITDTLSATTYLTAEETESLTINAATLSSINHYASLSSGGSYSIGGSDADKFDIDLSGNVTSNTELLLAEKANYSFNVYYDVGGSRFTEKVTLNLTEALQASTSLYVNESNQAIINREALKKLNSYAAADNYLGQYRLGSNINDPSDYSEFSIASDGTITSNAAVTFAIENRYDFDVIYTDSNGIEFQDSVVLNINDPTLPKVSLTAEETSALLISAANFANSAQFSSTYPNGSFQLSGTDAAKFAIDTNGNVTSNQSLALSNNGIYNPGEEYNFDIIYTSGQNTQTESVQLLITEALQATSTLTANEANSITLEAEQMSKINAFARRDRFNGVFAISATGVDYNLFSVDQNGTITSNGPLDFTTKPTYSFDLNYTSSDNTVFTETVNLNLLDTLTSNAEITSEETLSLNIPASTFSSTATYAGLNTGGTYSITGTDANYFSVDGNGAVTSTQSLLQINKSSFDFNLVYSASGGRQHTEYVNVAITEALQGTSDMIADESGQVKIFIDSLVNLSGFASRDGSQGSYAISQIGPDYSKFYINSDGNIMSVGALDFSSQATYSFDLIYTASDGRRYTETVNLSLNDTLNSTANLTAVESQSLNISAATLASTSTYAGLNSGGSYSLTGNDASKFSIDSSGNITSTQTLLTSEKSQYQFNVIYNAGIGKQHIENVTLDLIETLSGSSTITAVESNQINIANSVTEKIHRFAERDGFSGSFRINNSGNDYDKFTVLSDGTIRSNGSLDYSTQQSYSFDLIYTASDNRQFVETITLNLADTLLSIAQLQAEEAQLITIAAATLTSTATYAANNMGGTYRLTGADAAKFQIDANGNITSTQTLRSSVQNSYNFNVVYDVSGGQTHTETINFSLTEALQSQANLSAEEADQVVISANSLQAIQNFATQDSFGGNFRISNSGVDHSLFTINQFGDITSLVPLRFTTKSSYNFDVIYDAADGRQFVSAVTLNLAESLSASSSLQSEETENLTISSSTLQSTAAYANRNPGGNYSITGLDGASFNIDANGNVTSKKGLYLDTQENYQFTVKYLAPSGSVHNELISLGLDRAKQGVSSLSAIEAKRVTLPASSMSIIHSIAAADKFEGQFKISPTGSDYNLFAISTDGSISSKGSLDYSIQDSYSFDVIYTSKNGAKFTDTVNLSVNDTLTSAATLNVEESDQVDLLANLFTSTQSFAGLDGFGGTFHITGKDAKNFNIDTSGNVSSIVPLREATHKTQKFDIVYTASDNRQHIESVTLTIDRFLQASSTLEANEGRTVSVNAQSLSHLDDFASDDSYEGTFQLGTRGSDHNLFSISKNGVLRSKSGLDYDHQNQFSFDIIYNSTDGAEFTNTVDLSIKDTLTGTSSISVEESTQVAIDHLNFTSLIAYAAKDGNAGTFSIDPKSQHGNLFTVSSDGSLLANTELSLAKTPILNLAVKYNAVSIPDFTENITINLTPTTNDTTRSALSVAEASEVIIVPNLNPYLKAYAEADQYAGEFQLSNLPGSNNSDFYQFSIDETGKITSNGPVDFENGKLEYAFRVIYRHSTSGNSFTDYLYLTVNDDLRDNNNLALEDLDLSSGDNAVEAVTLLDRAIARVTVEQSNLGALQNRLTYKIDSLSTNELVTETSKGRIIDANFALESSKLAQSRILESATTAMLSHANLASLNVLMLVR